MARSRLKKLFGLIHLWVGLFSGALIFLISISGAVYVFRDELYNWIHSDVQINEATAKASPLPLSRLWNAAQKKLGSRFKIEDATAFSAYNRNWEFGADKRNDKAITYFGWVEYDYIIYVNPYTAEVAGVVNHKYEFFQLVKMFHWSLLLHTRYGQPIVGSAILLFVASLISGLVIWWPKGYKQFKQNMKVRWKARWRRINYDLHRALAVCTLPLALAIALSGLVWAFDVVQTIVYVVASQSVTPPAKIDIKSAYDSVSVYNTRGELMDGILKSAFEKNPGVFSISFFPSSGKDTTATFGTYVRPGSMAYYNGISEKYDQYSGKLLYTSNFNTLNNGEKILYMNYDIHVGQILGMPGKIIAFVASLLCASLPVSGFLIWWGRRKIASQKEARLVLR